jgi:peptidoglycan hydrolase-like protein with peptidoglycan-binding domain
VSAYPQTMELRRPAGRLRITVDGVDVTNFRDAPTPEPPYSLCEPFAYGAATLTFPQIYAGYEAGVLGTGELAWVRNGARVVISRTFDDDPEQIDYVGLVRAIEPGGTALVLEVDGEFIGRAQLLQQQNQMYRSSRDVGRWASLVAATVGLSFSPWFGPDTDIELTHVGGQSHLAWAQYVCTMSQDPDGIQRTMMPTTWGGHTWEFRLKDYTTKHLTIFNDDARAVLNVSQDAGEAPNVIYGTGVTPRGERITNAKWPNVFAGPAPTYPMSGSFGVGTTNADTRNDDGIDILYIKLREMGYLPFNVENTGVYTTRIANAVKKLQRAAGLSDTGTMTKAAWNALYDNDVTGYSINGAYVAPLAEDPRVREWNRASNGAILGRNPLYDPSILRVERTIDFGAGITKATMIAYAEGIINRSATMKNWTGTLRLEGGVGVFAGEHDDSDVATLTADDIVPNKSIRPGMNLWAPYFDGGTLFHISGVDIDENGGATLTIDTQARDLLEVQAINERDAESRRDVRREWMAQNQTGKPSTHMVAYDEGFGILDRAVRLKGGRWNIIPVIAGQHGQVNRTRLQTINPKSELAAAAFSVHMTEKRLDRRVGNPLVTTAESVWEKESLQDWFDDDVILWAIGDGKQPGGYSPRRHRDDDNNVTTAPITGRLTDPESWPFIFAAHTAVIVYLAIYPKRDTTLKKGRILWPQLDSAA